MVGQLTIFFWVLVIIGSYVGTKYAQSRNKRLFFTQGAYKSFLWSMGLIIVVGLIVGLLLPGEPFDLSYLKLHNEAITQQLHSATGWYKYFLLNVSIFTEMNLLGFVSALLVTGIWLYYVRNLDFFRLESVSYTILGFALGMFATFFTFPLSDLVRDTFEIAYSSSTFYNLFVYSFLGIGIVEETIKLVPVICILLFTREIDEPIDLIYYACISALGFAFLENLLYFKDISGSIIIGRALTSAVGHMIDSSIVVYGIVLYKFKPDRKKFSVVLYYFLLGAFCHALYDYFLFEDLILFFVASFAFFIQCWAIIINNAINNSKHFDYKILYKHDAVKFNMALAFTLLSILTFVLNGFLVGRSAASETYVASLGWISLLLIFYTSTLSSFDLLKGYWRPVKFRFSSPSDQAMPGMRGFSIFSSVFTENTVVPLNHVGKKIKLHSPTYNQYLCEIFHTGGGQIVNRLILETSDGNQDVDWFLVKLETPLDVNDDFHKQYILIKLRSKHASLIHDEHIKCWLKLIPKGINPLRERLVSSFYSYGFIIINGEDYQFKSE